MAKITADTETDVVFIDALGTLVALEPPWIGLRAALGADCPPEHRLVGAVRIEMGYYRDHAVEGRDEQSLAKLRAASAQVLSSQLGFEVPPDVLVDAISFNPFPEAVEALAGLRERGLKLICVSNWDISLGEVLQRCGLADSLDGVVCSAEVGVSKPDPAVFERALELAGTTADRALHVGDTVEEDVAGAKAAGIRALHIDRDGGNGDIASLTEIAAHV